jgi:hypothetical protein
MTATTSMAPLPRRQRQRPLPDPARLGSDQPNSRAAARPLRPLRAAPFREV